MIHFIRDHRRIFKPNNWTDYYKTISEKISVSNFKAIELCEIQDFTDSDETPIEKTF